jgi:hypothetical protein
MQAPNTAPLLSRSVCDALLLLAAERRPELTAPSPARASQAAVPSALAAAARESPAAAPASAPARPGPPPATAAAPHSVDWLGLLAAALVGAIALLLSRKLMGDANDA